MALNHYLFKIYFLLFIFNIIGCTDTFYKGNYISDQLSDVVQNQELSASEVKDILGPPSYIPEHNNVWYYIYREMKSTAGLPANVKEQKIFKIIFDEKGIVKQTETLKNGHQKVGIKKLVTINKVDNNVIIKNITNNFKKISKLQDKKNKQKSKKKKSNIYNQR